jgi:hypothetical protein
MEPISSIYYHGTNGDAILKIIETGTLLPDENQRVFLSRYTWESCFMHGGDRKRQASFVIKVRIGPLDTNATFTETPGVRDTVEIRTDRPIPVEVCEMYVRRLTDGIATLRRVAPVDAIKQYLSPTQ